MSYVCDGVEVSQKTASGVVKSRRGEFYGLVVIASSSGNITIYDNDAAASGTKLYEKAVTAGDVVHFGGSGMLASKGIYFSLVSGTATVNVLYK